MPSIGLFDDFLSNLGPLAQSVEQRTFNPWVVGSIPTGPTLPYKFVIIYFKKLDFVLLLDSDECNQLT
jgi:hypothetical protein